MVFNYNKKRNERTIIINRPPISLNQQERMHWTRWHDEKLQWRHDIFYLVKESGNAIPKNLSHVWIEINVYFKKIRCRDESNYEPMVIKPLLDALVYAKIIKDDTAAYVTRPGMIFIGIDKHNPRTEIKIAWES